MTEYTYFFVCEYCAAGFQIDILPRHCPLCGVVFRDIAAFERVMGIERGTADD